MSWMLFHISGCLPCQVVPRWLASNQLLILVRKQLNLCYLTGNKNVAHKWCMFSRLCSQVNLCNHYLQSVCPYTSTCPNNTTSNWQWAHLTSNQCHTTLWSLKVVMNIHVYFHWPGYGQGLRCSLFKQLENTYSSSTCPTWNWQWAHPTSNQCHTILRSLKVLMNIHAYFHSSEYGRRLFRQVGAPVWFSPTLPLKSNGCASFCGVQSTQM